MNTEDALHLIGDRIGEGLANHGGLAHFRKTLRRRSGLVGDNIRVGGGSLPRSQQPNNLLKLYRWVGRIGELHVIEGAGYSQSYVNTLRLRLQAKIEDRVDAERVIERDGSSIYRVSRVQEYQLALTDYHSARDPRL